MELFKTLAEILPEGETLRIVVKRIPDDRMTVTFHPDGEGVSDDIRNKIGILGFNGTPEELDAEVIPAIISPLKQTEALFTSAKDYEASIKNAVKALDKKKADSKKTDTKKADDKKKASEKPAPEVKDEKPAQDSVFAESEAQQEKAQEVPQPAPTEQALTPEADAPKAQDVIKEDIKELWNRGRAKYSSMDYKGALKDFERCREIADPRQYGSIDKAMETCRKHIQGSIFNGEE